MSKCDSLQKEVALLMKRARRKKSWRGDQGRGPTDYTLRKRAEKVSECLRLYPQEVALGLAKRDEAGWAFGRLFLVGAIDAEQYEAAKRLDRVVRQYKYMFHRHGLVAAMNLDMMMTGTLGISTEDLSETAIRECEKACDAYIVSYNRLGKCGLDVRKAILTALDKDLITDLHLLRRGLDGLMRR